MFIWVKIQGTLKSSTSFFSEHIFMQLTYFMGCLSAFKPLSCTPCQLFGRNSLNIDIKQVFLLSITYETKVKLLKMIVLNKTRQQMASQLWSELRCVICRPEIIFNINFIPCHEIKRYRRNCLFLLSIVISKLRFTFKK